MALFKLRPSFKSYLWGGHRLVDEFNKNFDGDILAESWELSCHSDGPSYIEGGLYDGITLSDYIEKNGRGVLGSNCDKFEDFPILIKLIDAKKDLSVQVHPDNEYALKNEGQYGKTEMWYIVDCKPGAQLFYGFKDEISKEEFQKRIKENTLTGILNAVKVKKGDVFFIESGTIHAIGKDIVIAEIQQNSNVTYRVYDYGRKGPDGKERELHIDKAVEVTKRVPPTNRSFSPNIAACEYFTVDKLYLDGENFSKISGTVTDRSFMSVLFLDGCGEISCGEEKMNFKKGDSFFLTANSGEYEIRGKGEALVTVCK